MTIKAAGVLFLAPGDQVLYLKRGAGGDYPGAWCFPGGQTEEGETAEQTALREAREELGKFPSGTVMPWVRSVTPGYAPLIDGPLPGEAALGEEVDFTTFVQRVEATFEPKLNGEHVGWAWAPLGQPPEPMHPGCRVALDRFGMDELGIARAMAEGRLTSPQKYQNVWLFNIRITGTATAYRPQRNEFVYRRPENYLTDDFLARCNGLPVIIEHPEGNMLDGKEFADRSVGTIFLPFIRGDEVWGVAKIYNEIAAEQMATTQASTSPGVVLGGENSKFQMEDGSTLLIEGSPILLDHICITARGVWDKGGAPAGVESIEAIGDSAMTEEERARKDAEEKAERERADAARKDSDDKIMSALDSIAKVCDSLKSRMDAIEAGGTEETAADKARKDAEEKEKSEKDEKERADKARKDTEEKTEKEEKERADAARKDSADMKARLASVESMLPRARTDADHAAIADAWSAANHVMTALGDSAVQAMPGEDVLAFRRRVLLPLKAHSTVWKDVDLSLLPVDTFSIAESQIRKDALAAAMSPSSVKNGGLRPVERRLASGHTEITWVGHPRGWMDTFAGSGQRAVGEFQTNLGGRR